MSPVRVALVAGVVAAACNGKAADPPAPAGAHAVPTPPPAVDAPVAASRTPSIGARVAAGSLRQPQVLDGYFVLVPANAAPEAARRAAEAAAKARGAVATIDVRDLAQLGYKVDYIKYFGRDVSPDDLGPIAKVKVAVVIFVHGDQAKVADVLHASAAAARAGAGAVRGWIVDAVTMETFTRASFDQRRPDDFPLDASSQTVVHQVSEDGGTAFLETFGLVRFGLPELYLRGVPRSFVDDTTQLVDAVAQTLIERGALNENGTISVDLATLRSPPWQAKHDALVAAKAPGKVSFAATWSLGDNANDPDQSPEIELSLPGGAEPEQLRAAIVGYFGPQHDPVIMAKDDDAELLAASQRAKGELAKLAPHFAHGIPDLERLLVKAPFRTDSGGIEWMWIEVQSWKGSRLEGLLVNQPDNVSALKEGARVEARQDDLFDYVYTHADGTESGGETNRILEQRQ